MIRTGATTLAIGLLFASVAQAERMSECSYWQADPHVSESIPIEFRAAVTLLFDRGELRVQPMRNGRPTRGSRMIRLRGTDGRMLRELTVSSSFIEDAGGQRDALRLPVGVSVLDADRNEVLDFSEFLLPSNFERDGVKVVDAGGATWPRTPCLDAPGAKLLIAMGDLRPAGPGEKAPEWDKSYSYPGGGPSLRDIVKGGAGDGGGVAAGPSLGEIARGGGAAGEVGGTPSLRELRGGGGTPNPAGPAPADDRTPAPVVVTELAPATPVAAADPVMQEVCVPGLSAPVRATLNVTPGGAYLAGFRNAAVSAPAVTYSALLDAGLASEGNLALTATPGSLELLEVFKSGTEGGKPVALVRPLGAQLDTVAAPEADPAPVSEHELVIRLFGEPERIGISGLALIDEATADLRRSAVLRILWHDVAQDGAISAPQTYDSFAAVVAAAKTRENWDVNYSLASNLQRFADGIVTTLENSPERTDLSIWVLEGMLLPDETPQILSDMIRRVGASGNIPRFESDRAPRRWLYVLAGQFAQSFSEGYLRGPVQRSNPAIGEIDIEIRGGGEARSLLTDPVRPAQALRSQFSRLGIPTVAAAPAAAPADEGDTRPAIDAESGYVDIGLVIEASRLNNLIDELLNTREGFRAFVDKTGREGTTKITLDATSLFRPRSDEGAQVQNFGADTTIESVAMQRSFMVLAQRGQADEFDAFLKRLALDEAWPLRQAAASGRCSLVYLPVLAFGEAAE